MGSIHGKRDEEYAFIKEKGELGFIDYEDDKSVCTYNPEEEGPITISIPFPFINRKPQSITEGQTSFDQITIKNTTNEPVELWKVDIYDSNPKDSFTLSLMEPPSETSDEEYKRGFVESFCLEDRVLQPNKTLTVWLSCKPNGIGLHTTAVHFDVDDDRIERLVFLFVEDKVSQSLQSNKPYRRERKKKQLVADASAKDAYVVGSRPARASTRGYKYRLPSYPIPKDVRESIENKNFPDVIAEVLTPDNYCSYFHFLLNMEEVKMEEDMRGYDMKCASLGRKGQLLTLVVPGLAERRPSLVCGDFVYAKLASEEANDATRPYQGYIHRVEAEEVHLKFDKEFHSHHLPANFYGVQFTYNRVSMRKLYQAIGEAEHLETDFLFPQESSRKRLIGPTRLVPFSSILNKEQKRSVSMILACKGGPPYVIHGPPGTGKTMTVVEAILQLYINQNVTKILVCAPSNSAADHLLEKLLSEKAVEVKENDILRLNAVTRPFEDIKSDLFRFCYFDNDESIFKCPPLRDLKQYRIVISTYMSASLLYAEGIKRGHFTHIFLDEAGQASEPETMVPLAKLCERVTVVVLAGDPMQLGPVIHSKEAEDFGLGISFLARLFECEFYDKGNESYVTKLVQNYRCAPEILYLPSQLFYRGELIASKVVTGSSMSWVDLLPNKKFPAFFIGIQGCDEREGSNPSWFNRFEASKVIEIIKKLMRKWGVNGEDIGVITPYRQQVLKLNKALENLDCCDIKVGSVEQFQGQERKVIIVSTVRSTIKHNKFDRAHCLGFLSNPKRFNVAITRAKALLIVIGNPHIIGKDRYWNKLLWYCVENGSYEGCPLPERQDYLVEETQEESYEGYDEEYPQPSDEVEQKREAYREEEFPKPVCGEAEQKTETYGEEELPKPVFDEAEWSDGWK